MHVISQVNQTQLSCNSKMELELLLLTAVLGKRKEQCFGSIFDWFYPIPRHNNLIFVFLYMEIVKFLLIIAVIPEIQDTLTIHF